MANDFSGSADCVFVGNFDLGGLLVDSSPGGTNTLTNTNSVGQSATAKQGDRSADFDGSNWLSRIDTNLASGFPGKNGESNLDFTVCGWYFSTSGGVDCIVSKYLTTDQKQFILNYNGSTNTFQIFIGSGASASQINTGSSIDHNKWFHYAFTYTSSTQGWTLRVWDDSGSSIVVNTSGVSGTAFGAGTAPFVVGARDAGTATLTGLEDEVVVFNTVRNSTDTDAIRAGTFDEPAVVGGGKTNRGLLTGVYT